MQTPKSFDTITIDCGDKHYQFTVECGILNDHRKHKIYASIYEGMAFFCEDRLVNFQKIYQKNLELQAVLHEVAARHPESRGLIMKALC